MASWLSAVGFDGDEEEHAAGRFRRRVAVFRGESFPGCVHPSQWTLRVKTSGLSASDQLMPSPDSKSTRLRLAFG